MDNLTAPSNKLIPSIRAIRCLFTQRYETILQIEALRIVVLGEEVHSEDADSLRHIAGCFQEVGQKQLTETLASAGQIDSKPPEVRRGQRISWESRLVIRRQMVAQKGTGR